MAKIATPEAENDVDDDFGEIKISLDTNISPIHYISWLAGIFISCLYIGAITIVPLHNTLYEPQYYWEFMLFAAFGWVSAFNAGFFVSTRYWANLHPGPWKTAFILIMIISSSFNIVFTITYHYLWVDILGFYAPMPLAYYLPGTYTAFLCFALGFYRYIQ